MAVTTLSGLSESQKNELIASLSVLVAADGASGPVSADSIAAVATASGNTLPAIWATIYSAGVGRAGGIGPFCQSSGGGGGGGGGGGEAAAEVEEEKPVEEEEEIDMGGGMDMFGGGDEGGGDY